MLPPSDPPVRTIRGQRAILDYDLASLFEVSTKRLMEQVRRHPLRFPSDTCFSLTLEEAALLKSSIRERSPDTRGSRFTSSARVPIAFTADGAVMASTVLHTPPAIATCLLVARFHNQALDLLGRDTSSAARLVRLEKSFGRMDRTVLALWTILSQLRGSPASSRGIRRQR